MIHKQEHGLSFYAYCECGVCGPIRRTHGEAKADDCAHRRVCSEKKP